MGLKPKVYLVASGVANPWLLARRAEQCLSWAEALAFDEPVEDIAGLAPGGIPRLRVRIRNDRTEPGSGEVCQWLLEVFEQGRPVVRLYRRDPMLVPYGIEEVRLLEAAGVEFELVPSVGWLEAALAYSGVPVASGDGYWVAGPASLVEAVGPELLARGGLYVFDVREVEAPALAQRLSGRGWPRQTPVVLIRQPAHPRQQLWETTLEGLAGAALSGQTSCALLIGPRVQERRWFDWFGRLPLRGRRMVVTRALEQAGEMAERLRELGAEVVELPTIELAPLADYQALDEAIERLESYDWLVFTSANGVRFFLERLDQSRKDLRAVRGRVCAIGPATRKALEQLHLKVDLMPGDYVAEAVVEAFRHLDMRGRRVLLPRAEQAREVLPQSLRQMGAHVDVVPAYRTVMPEGLAERARRILAHPPDWILFTSSSTVRNFVEAAGRDALRQAKIGTIGPVTSQTVRQLGGEVTVEASPYTVAGLIDAVLEYERSHPA